MIRPHVSWMIFELQHVFLGFWHEGCSCQSWHWAWCWRGRFWICPKIGDCRGFEFLLQRHLCMRYEIRNEDRRLVSLSVSHISYIYTMTVRSWDSKARETAQHWLSSPLSHGISSIRQRSVIAASGPLKWKTFTYEPLELQLILLQIFHTAGVAWTIGFLAISYFSWFRWFKDHQIHEISNNPRTFFKCGKTFFI